MTRASVRILFHVPSRRGLGHVMRSANLARAVMAAEPRAATLVHLATPAASVACGSDVAWTSGSLGTTTAWRGLVDTFRPSLVVFDTVLPGLWAADPTPRAFVWRQTAEARHADVAADARLDDMRVIVVPHDRAEFGHQLPPALEARAVFAGPIVRATDVEGQARVRRRYGLAESDTVITSTVGGGGFAGSAAWLLQMVLAAHASLRARLPRLRHVVVRGPLAAGPATAVEPGMTLVDADPDLVHLLALSHLVVAEAGYNTANEIRVAGVPALLVPGERRYDDQAARARTLTELGVARMIGRESTSDAVAALVDLATDAAALQRMREASRHHQVRAGNAAAAAALLQAAR